MNNEIDEITQRINSNGGMLWSRSDGNIYSPIGFSSIEVLNVFGDMGLRYNTHQTTKSLCDFIVTRFDNKSGLFSYSASSSKLPCVSAKILSSLFKVEYPHQEIFSIAANKLVTSQANDGGWRCSTVKIGKAPETDASNPGTTLYVLDFLRNFPEIVDIVEEQSVNFLLNHWETKKPLGPCEFGIGSTFLKTEYPLIRYNILYYVFTLSHFDRAKNDSRFRNAVSVLLDKKEDGHLRIENPHKKWKPILFPDDRSFSEYSDNLVKEIERNLA